MITLIVNPAAGNGRAPEVAAQACTQLKARGLAFRQWNTAHPGEATQLARKASEDSDLIVSCGGDGTVREVAAGLVGTQAVLGLLPGGRGNDLRRAMGIPSDIPGAIEVLVSGTDKAVDLLRVNGEICVNIYSVGFDVAVAANSRKFSYLQSNSYYASVLYTVFHYRAQPMRITLDGAVREGSCYLIAFGNGRWYGGGMEVLPQSVSDDGWIDVCLIDPVTIPQVFRLLPKFMKGKHGAIPQVHFHRIKTLTVESPYPLPAQADGDPIAPHTLTQAEILPAALKIRVPQDGKG